MATVNHTLTLTSNDLTSDTISLTLLNTLGSAVQGGVIRQKIEPTAVGSAVVLGDKDQYTQGARVWLHNPSTAADVAANYVYISLDSTAKQITLKPGDWALFPWSAGSSGTPQDLEAFAHTAGNILEWGIYSV